MVQITAQSSQTQDDGNYLECSHGTALPLLDEKPANRVGGKA
ncbi:MAG TPA: hypothetical protein VES89_12555 [Candidatus Competibacteraceae bacterium]|nr:hypothetical protein [Candidatus Competibacteraceae bacterium]